MTGETTSGLLEIQAVCHSSAHNYSVIAIPMGKTDTVLSIGPRVKIERERRKWSQKDLADRITGLLFADGSSREVKQQSIDQLEKARLKSIPDWVRFVWIAFEEGDAESGAAPDRPDLPIDDTVGIKRLPTWAGLGSGGTGDDEVQIVQFSRDLVVRELRADPEKLLAMLAEGNSMEPVFYGGDQILVDTRRLSLAQPGAFCLWDGDGHVIKYLERIPGSDPPRVKVMSANGMYEPHERLVEEIRIVGRVIWFGRRVQ
jgi:transcriptional regulator with XRE-family HTH domain